MKWWNLWNVGVLLVISVAVMLVSSLFFVLTASDEIPGQDLQAALEDVRTTTFLLRDVPIPLVPKAYRNRNGSILHHYHLYIRPQKTGSRDFHSRLGSYYPIHRCFRCMTVESDLNCPYSFTFQGDDIRGCIDSCEGKPEAWKSQMKPCSMFDGHYDHSFVEEMEEVLESPRIMNFLKRENLERNISIHLNRYASMRNPLDRALSEFRWVFPFQGRIFWGYRVPRRLDQPLSQYMRTFFESNPLIHNRQSKMLAGFGSSDIEKKAKEHLLDMHFIYIHEKGYLLNSLLLSRVLHVAPTPLVKKYRFKDSNTMISGVEYLQNERNFSKYEGNSYFHLKSKDFGDILENRRSFISAPAIVKDALQGKYKMNFLQEIDSEVTRLRIFGMDPSYFTSPHYKRFFGVRKRVVKKRDISELIDRSRIEPYTGDKFLRPPVHYVPMSELPPLSTEVLDIINRTQSIDFRVYQFAVRRFEQMVDYYGLGNFRLLKFKAKRCLHRHLAALGDSFGALGRRNIVDCSNVPKKQMELVFEILELFPEELFEYTFHLKHKKPRRTSRLFPGFP